ncbi:MAG: ABC transporter permease [SAR324 cluster bacterium]|nr:ABC transporter permease [SAR324 cluster bacterium]
MVNYVFRRLLFFPVVFIALSLMIFSLQMLLSPVQRISAYITSNSELKGGREQIEALIKKYGLDEPFLTQYWEWIQNILSGNLGWSETARSPVSEVLISLFPATVELVILAFIPSFLGAVWLGTKAGANLNRPKDHAIRIFTILGWSFPTFVFGLIMLLIFYGYLNWFPPGRLSQWAVTEVESGNFIRYTGANLIDSLLNGRWQIFLDSLRHLIAPIITLTYVNLANMTRVMRTSMLETLRQDYIRTARAKGLSEKIVQNKHARRNALLPVTTMAGMELAYMMGGVVITETIFDYHGLGQFAAHAAANLDFPAVLGFALYFALVLVLLNLVVDLLYPLIDPRVVLK